MHLSQYPSQPYRTRVLKVEKEMADVLDDKVQVACPVEADPENPTTKTKKGKEKPAREPYLLCELCNNILTDSGHKKQEHREIDQLHALGAASLLPPMATAALDSASDEMLGGFIHHLLREADRGEEVFNVIRNATEQLHKLLHESLAERPNVFLFGSCVSMGIWDGLGDADFALDSPGLKNGSIKEGELLDLLARKLRHGGFQFNELEVVKRTRIPVIKRARGTKRAYELLRVRDPYILRYCFPSSGVRAIFLSKLKYLEKKYEGKCVVSKESDEVLMYCTNGAKALRLFSRLEEKGMVKEWKMNGRLPEIFSVDFDLSCRLNGVRNSWFLRQYMKQDSIFRVGNLFIKRWSKVSGVNNPRRGYLTSYAMTVLWVYYLLVKKEATFVNPESITVDHETQHDVNYLPLWKSEEASASVWSRLGQLVRGFFNFYDNFAWDQEVVCLRYDVAKTGARTREEHGWTREAEVDTVVLRDRVLYRLCIDDVYEDGLNLGRHQDDDKAAYVRLQFHRASLLCNASSPDTLPLLLENTPQHASSTVNVELYRYLAERSGHATVGEIRAHFAASPNAPFLSVYEVSNRLSDMWYDVAMLANDASENRYFGRWVDPNKPKPVWPAMDSWAAVCVDAYWAHEIATHDKRVVRLVANRTEEDPLGDEDPNASELESQLAIATKECCSIAQQLAREDVRHVGVPITESTSDLAKNYFFCVDDCRAFDTYREQMVFVAHLRTVALVLEKGHPMDHTTLGSDEDLIHSEGLALLSWQYKSNIAASILSCEFYVKKGTRHGEPTYTATDLLLHHLGDRGDEETIQRRSCFKKHFISSQ